MDAFEDKTIVERIVQYKYTLIIAICIFIVTLVTVMILYFKSGIQRRNTITTALTLFGSVILVFNILLIIYNELKQYAIVKTKMITDIDDIVNEQLRYVFREFMYNKQKLGKLYDEVFTDKIYPFDDNNKPIVTYYESNFLFIVFGIMQNFYRNYEFNTIDNDTLRNYNSWRHLMRQFFTSPKCQQFYSINKHLISDLLFNRYVELFVLPTIKIHIPISNIISKQYIPEYNHNVNKWNNIPINERDKYLLHNTKFHV